MAKIGFRNFLAIFCIVFSIINIEFVTAERRLRFTVTNITNWSDNKHINFTYTIDEKEPSADLMFKILTPINDLEFHVEGKFSPKVQKRHYGMVNATYSLCQLLALKNASPIGSLIFAHLKTYGHLPDSCPVKKDTYTIKGIWPEDQPAKLKLPETEFEGHLMVYTITNNEPLLIMDAHLLGESVYKELTGSAKKSGILSMLGK